MDRSEVINILQHFFLKSSRDPRIGKSHLAVFIAVFERWHNKEYCSPFRMFANEGARAARVSLSTYYQCIIDLDAHGYLRYLPSYRNDQGSQISFGPF